MKYSEGEMEGGGETVDNPSRNISAMGMLGRDPPKCEDSLSPWSPHSHVPSNSTIFNLHLNHAKILVLEHGVR